MRRPSNHRKVTDYWSVVSLCCARPRRQFVLPSRPMNELLARIEQLEIVDDGRVGGIELISLEKFDTRLHQIAAQHIGISLVVEDLDGLAGQANGAGISLVGEIKAADPVIARGKPDPGGGILGRFFYRIAKVTLGDPVLSAR